MWHASNVILNKAKKDTEGSYYQLMASLVFTAFTLEAYLNHIGQRTFNCWKDLEWLPPRKKLNVIAEKLGIKKDDGKRPFQTVSRLFKFRDNIAHGKSVPLKPGEQIVVVDDEFDKRFHESLKTDWEKYCTLENAERAREDVENIIRILHDASGVTDDSLFGFGLQIGAATLIPEKSKIPEKDCTIRGNVQCLPRNDEGDWI